VNSPFDRFLKGDANAIDAEQQLGYRTFKEYGCASCHQGANVGGNLYEKFGVMGDYFKDRGTPETDADLGRFAVTKREQDKHVFKVPSLRNLPLTAPYFHDGSATTLPQAVEVMAKYQLGRPIDPERLRAICRFLESLTGDQPTVSK
jgi:cytochrome c peroxidase